jgi:sugar phosphate isomerase/epimerase
MRYSYATVGLPDLSPERAVEELARAGYQGLEWKVGAPPYAMSSTAAARFLTDNECTLAVGTTDCERIRGLCADAGLAIVGLGPYLRVGDTMALQEVLEMAIALGAPQIRLQAPRTGHGDFSYHDLAQNMVDFLSAAEVLGRRTGVRVVVEIHHNTIAPSASLAYRLVSRFDPAVIGIIYDVGNLVWEGYEDHRIGLQILGPYLHHVHLKNAAATMAPTAAGKSWTYTWSPLDDGLVDVASVLGLLGGMNYDGWISLEDLSTIRDSLSTLRFNAAVLAATPEAAWAGGR